MSNGYLQNPYSEVGFVPNTFAQGIAAPPMSVGRKMGHIGEGANIAGLFGVQDPAASLLINQFLQPILTGYIGGNYVPAQFSAGGNLYSQVRMGNTLRASSTAMGLASQLDQKGIYEAIRGSARLMDQPFGAREQAAASEMASTLGMFVPMLAQKEPDLVDKLYGARGSATVMAQNMFRGGRYAIDPTTGRRGYSGETAAEITKGVYQRLYGDNANIAEMSGLTAGRAGQLFDEMQRRGMMPNTGSRSAGIKEIADQLGTTITDVAGMPDLDRKLRELDASKISDRLKGMSRAVSAMQEIFGEMGEADAPMNQLVGAIETLTQANMQNMDPVKLERMIRTTSATAKAAGIEMPEMFRSMGATAAYADRAGVDRALVPSLDARAVMENQAMKNLYGGVRAFGVPSADKMADVSRQLVVQAARDQRTYEAANIARAIEQYGVKPTKGSELEAVYKAITDPNSKGQYQIKDPTTGRLVTKNITDIMKQPGGINQFMISQGVNQGIVTNMLANRSGTEEFIDKYKLAESVGRSVQTDMAVSGTFQQGIGVIDMMLSNNAGKKGVLMDALRKKDTAQAISMEVSEALYSGEVEGIGDPEKRSKYIAGKIRNIVKRRTGQDIPQDDDSLMMLSGSLGGAADQFIRNKMNMSLPAAQMLLNRKVKQQADSEQAMIDVDVEMESKLRDLGKTSIFQRMSDFIRSGKEGATVSDFLASAFNYQDASTVKSRYLEDFSNVFEAAKGFSGYKGEEAKLNYIKNAAVINQAEMDKATTPEQKAKLTEEREDLKKQLIDFNGSTEADADKGLNAIVEEAKNKASKPGNINQAAAAARNNLSNFKKRFGVTAEEAKTMNLNDINLKGKRYFLDEVTRQGQSLGIQLNAAGLVSNINAVRELNESVNALSSSDPSQIGFGLITAKDFINNLSPELIGKGGKEGMELRGKIQNTMTNVANMAKVLGVKEEDLIAGKLPTDLQGADLSTLKRDMKDEFTLVETLNGLRVDDVAYANNINAYKAKFTELQNKSTRTPDEEKRMEIYKRVSAIDRDKIGFVFEDMKERKKALDSQTPESLKASIAQYRQAETELKNNATAVDRFVKSYNEANKTTSTIQQLTANVEPEKASLEKVQNLRAQKYENRNNPVEVEKLDAQIQAEIKKSGLNESNYMVMKEVDNQRFENYMKYIKPRSPEEDAKFRDLEQRIGKRVRAAETAFGEKDLKELKSLEARDIANKSVVEFNDRANLLRAGKVGSKDAPDSNKELYALLNKYNSFNEAFAQDKDKIISLAGIRDITELEKRTGKGAERQEKDIKEIFNAAKAAEAGIKYGQAFVVEKGRARPATPEEIKSGNFSYFNKTVDGKELKRTYEDYESLGSKPTKDSLKYSPLDSDESARLVQLREKMDSKNKELASIETKELNEYRELLRRQTASLGIPDAEMVKEFAIKAGMTNEVAEMYLKDPAGYERAEKDRRGRASSVSNNADQIRKIAASNQSSKDKLEKASNDLAKFDPRVLAAALGKDGLNSITAQARRQLQEDINKLGITTTTGGTPLSKQVKDAIVESSGLMSGQISPIDLFENKIKATNLGDRAKLAQQMSDVKVAPGLLKVGSLVRMGMAQAGELSSSDPNKKPTTPEAQAQALYNLLTADESKLSDQQKALKTNLKDNRITKDSFVLDGNGKASLDMNKLTEIGKDFTSEMNKKKALDTGSTGGTSVVQLKEGTELKMSGNMNITTGDSTLLGIVGGFFNKISGK